MSNGPDSDGFIIIPGRGHSHASWNPPWKNPNKFPRHEPLGESDEEAIMRIAEIEKKLSDLRKLREEQISLHEQMAVIQADIDAHKARLFPMLRKNHPKVVTSDGYGYGWRHFGEQYYVIGWDEATVVKYQKEQEEKRESGGAEDAEQDA